MQKNKTKKKNCLIVATDFNYVDERFFEEKYDVISLEIDHQFYLKSLDIEFTTIEQYYDFPKYNKSFKDFNLACDNWMKICDEHIFPKVNLENIFTGNGFWFSHRLNELYFLQKFIDSISSKYKSIEIITNYEIDINTNINVTFNDLSFGQVFGVSNDRLLKLLLIGIKNKKVKKVKRKKRIFYSSIYYKDKFYWFYDGLKRKLLNLNYLNSISIINKKNFWILQEGYDSNVLIKFLKNINFKFIKPILIKSNATLRENNNIDKPDIEIIKSSIKFLEVFIPSFADLFLKVIQSYCLLFLNHIGNFNQLINDEIDSRSPKALVLPMCAQDYFDYLIVKIANKRNIPVFYFKHNGAAETFMSHSLFAKYLEKEKTLKRVQFIHGRKEKDSYENQENINLRIAGPLDKPDYIEGKRFKYSLLYSFGSPSKYTLKDVSNTSYDIEKLDFFDEILKCSLTYGIKVYVKVHPRGSEEIHRLLTQIKKNSKYRNIIKIIYRTKIENLYSKFDLFVSDTLFSKAISNAMYSNMKIIAYCPRKEVINKKYYDLLCKRIHLLHNCSDINQIIKDLHNNYLGYNSNPAFIKDFLGHISTKESINSIKRELKIYDLI